MANKIESDLWVFGNRSLEDLLERTNVLQVVPVSQDVVTLPPNTTVGQAIKTLAAHRILSAPVEASPSDVSSTRKRYLGFIDMFDLLAYTLKMYTEDKGPSGAKQLHVWCQDIHKLSIRGQAFENHLVKDIVDLSRFDPFCSISTTAKLSQLLFLFQKGIHRVAIMEEQKDSLPQIRNIISQSDVISFLAKNINHFGKLGHCPIEDLNLGQKSRIISVSSQSKAIHAFYQMIQRNVSAVAIVDKQGVLVASISATDLRGLQQENFSGLLLPVLEFIQLHVPDLIIPPLTVRSSTTFETVILKLAAARTHRLWVIDEMDRPVGVISLTDVMKLLDLRCYIKETEYQNEQS